MSNLGDILKDEMPIDRVVAECDECGLELFDSMKRGRWRPYKAGLQIELHARKHRADTGHDSLDVDVTKPTTVKDEIDVEVTVNG